mmetsp:Transcript_33959/g.62427  ORF Transcript_33959/g.62427 Transcript_33959/m.62427 type:complete len:304 (-) Transcript_33959:126-1037(-)
MYVSLRLRVGYYQLTKICGFLRVQDQPICPRQPPQIGMDLSHKRGRLPHYHVVAYVFNDIAISSGTTAGKVFAVPLPGRTSQTNHETKRKTLAYGEAQFPIGSESLDFLKCFLRVIRRNVYLLLFSGAGLLLVIIVMLEVVLELKAFRGRIIQHVIAPWKIYRTVEIFRSWHLNLFEVLPHIGHNILIHEKDATSYQEHTNIIPHDFSLKLGKKFGFMGFRRAKSDRPIVRKGRWTLEHPLVEVRLEEVVDIVAADGEDARLPPVIVRANVFHGLDHLGHALPYLVPVGVAVRRRTGHATSPR